MINTYSESQLHKTLKNLYANEFNGKVEQKINGKICDILTEENRIIEIQTGNLSQLKNKIETLTPEYKMTIVYPLAIIKRIETRSKTGTVISNKKSPKKLNLFHIFKEITKIYPYLSKERVTLEILETEITEIRIKTDEPIQLINKSRRFLKNWYKEDKKLNTIFCKHIFTSTKDLVNILPTNLPDFFSTKDLAQAGAKKEAGYITWVLRKTNDLILVEKRNKTHIYKINKDNQ